MTLAEIKTMLSVGTVPVAYRKFNDDDSELLDMPYIVFYEESAKNFYADGVVYSSLYDISAQLYTRYKDLTTEALIETALNAQQITWSRTEQYYGEEDIYEVTYRFTA